MNLILFVHKNASQKGQNLNRVMNLNFNMLEIESLQTLNALKSRLKKVCDYNKDIFVLLTDSNQRLIELTSLFDLLEGKRILLVLPDDSKTNRSAALKLYPRFFTNVSDTYDDLCAVITKITHHETKVLTN